MICLIAASRAQADTGRTPADAWLEALNAPPLDLRALRAEMTSWLTAHPEVNVELPERSDDTKTEVTALRLAATAIRAALTNAAGGAASPFYLGRVDVSVTADVPAPGMTVLSAQDARTFNRATLSELLTLAPGITSAAVGARNEETLYLRGFDLRQTPLYIDGVPVYVPYDGYVDLARFLTADVAEVRISKGLTSGLYGPNTLGGAINVISTRPTQKLDAIGTATFGSGDRRELDLHAGTRMSRWYATGGIARLQRDTFPLASDFQPTAAQADGDRNNAYARDTKGTATVGYLAPSGTEVALRVVSQRGEKGNPPYAGTDSAVRLRYWQWPEWNKDSVYAIGNVPLGANADGWLRVRAYYDTFVNALFSYDDAKYTTQARPSSFRSHYDDYTVGTTVEGGWRLTPRFTVRGAGHVKQDIHREANEGEPQRKFEDRVLSGGVEGTFALSTRWTLVGGVSADRQRTRRAEDFQNGIVSEFPRGRADGVNPQAALTYGFADGGRLHVGVSRKTRLPSIKDRYSYRMGQAVPNADLRAERATRAEAATRRCSAPARARDRLLHRRGRPRAAVLPAAESLSAPQCRARGAFRRRDRAAHGPDVARRDRAGL